MEELLKNVKEQLENLNVDSRNIFTALVKLLEIMHAHGLDDEAIAALSECGIKLEVGEE